MLICPVGGFAHENILQSGVNQIDNKCLRICEPCGVCSLPFLSAAAICCLVFISLLYGMPHSSSSKSAHWKGENAWLQCPLVAADGTCVDKTLENCTIELLQAYQPKVVVIISILVLS